MKKLFKIVLVVAIIIIGGLFAYDLYMRNSGIENRLQYEKQKYELRNGDIDPSSESGKERRQRRREERRSRRNGN